MGVVVRKSTLDMGIPELTAVLDEALSEIESLVDRVNELEAWRWKK